MKRRERANPGIPRHLDQAAGSAADAARHAALRDDPVPLAFYGDGADEATRAQMQLACRLGIAARGARMPDAHVGYGLPIGGVLATRGAVIPYAVGVDIACRMRLSVFDQAMGHARPPDHPVMDADWNVSPVTPQVRDRARAQLGSSGSGNHVVEFGAVSAVDGAPEDPRFRPGQAPALALLSHSGSRGAGARVCDFYTKRAVDRRPHLDGALKRLVVHRKGATPAHAGCLGIIPGSMASPAYIVRGRGDAASLHSASHGAGRLMSRTEVRRRFNWSAARRLLAERGVTLLSAGLDEVPLACRDIDQVMAAQRSLVDTLGRFDPAIVRMAPDGEAPED